MKETDINSNKKSKKSSLIDNYIELSLISSDDDKKENTLIDELFPANTNNSILPKKKFSVISNDSQSSQSEEDDEDKGDTFILFPSNFFSFNLIFYILIFFLLYLSSFNFSYITLPYTIIAILLCLLSNVAENNKFYNFLYVLRILLFPFVCVYSLALIIFKIYIFSKIFDNDVYPQENKDFLLNICISPRE